MTAESSKVSDMIKDIDRQLEAKENKLHIYSMSIAEKLRSFTSYQRALARKKIEEVLCNIDFSTLQQPLTMSCSLQPIQSPTTPSSVHTKMESTPHTLNYP